jgi:cobalt-zinc-cadmium efflux system outer membrane protein
VIAVPLVRNYLCVALLIASSVSLADPDDTIFFENQLTSDRLVTLVLHLNPGISELYAAAAVATLSAETAGSLDDPDFSYGFAPRTFGYEGQGLNQKIEISQSIPWPGTLAAREESARFSALSAGEDVNALRLYVAAVARGAYAEWYFAHKALDIHQSTHILLTELRSVAETRYAAGTALQQDVLQAELELLHLQRHGLLLVQQRESARATINALLNRSPDSQLPEPAEVAIPAAVAAMETLQHRALQTHPELRGLDAQIASYEAQVTVAEKAMWPDMKFMAGYNSLWDDADKRPIVGISINVPLNRSKRKAELSRAQWEVRRTQSQRINQRSQLLGQLAQAHAKTVESLKSIELYEDSLLPLADEFLNAALADYRSGTGDFLSVISAEQHKLTAAEELERNRADFMRRSAELDRWAGTTLQITMSPELEVNHVYQ